MKSSKRKISLAVALVFAALSASAAIAQTAPALLGGGSSLAAPLVRAEISVFPPADGSASYFAVGSGAGQTAFLNNDASQFGVGVTGTVNFANSDAPLLATQISGYSRAATDGPLIQIPYIVTPITIPLVNAPTGTGPALPNSTTPTVALNDDDLCGIFSGKLTNWNQVTNPDTNALYSTDKAITVVYRSDSSGTTDLLTAHLAAVCVPSNTASGVTFKETQHFANASDAIFPNGVPTAPATFVAASGSGAVAAQLVSFKTTTTAAIAYLSPDFTNTSLAPSSTPAQTNQLAVASLRNGSVDVVPTFQNATAAVGTVGAPANPADPAAWVPNASKPTTGYPISGTSQIILSQCYANHGNTPTVSASVVDFLNLHYKSNAAILNGNGFDIVPTAISTAITSNILSNASGLKLNIGNVTACAGIGR